MAYYNGRLTLGGVAGVFASVDDALSDTSENPVQNKVITNNVVLKADVASTVQSGNTNPVTSGAVYSAFRGSNYNASGNNSGTLKGSEREKVMRLPTLVTDALGSTLVMTKNSFYNGGALSSNLELTLPAGTYGDTMQLDFVNGATAYTVSINNQNSAPHTSLSFTATANTVYSIFFSWGYINAGTQGWRIETKTFGAII